MNNVVAVKEFTYTSYLHREGGSVLNLGAHCMIVLVFEVNWIEMFAFCKLKYKASCGKFNLLEFSFLRN